MAGPRSHRRWLLPAVVTLAIGLLARPARADEPLRLGPLTASDAKPIRIAADEVYSWPEGGEQVILLKGKALLEQGVVTVRAARIAVWVDTDGRRRTGAYRMQCVAEGDVTVDNGATRSKGAAATLELVTKRDPEPQAGRTILQAQGTDPFFRRALEIRPSAGTPRQTASLAVTPAQHSAPTPQWPTDTFPTELPPSPLTPIAPGPLPTIPVPGTNAVTPIPPPDPGATPGPPRMLSILPRSAQPFRSKVLTRPETGEHVAVFNGGVIVLVRNVQQVDVLDIEADRLVIWVRGSSKEILDRIQSGAQTERDEIELFLSGNVQIRTAAGKDKQDQQVLRAEQVYYDVRRNAAVAVQADLELFRPGMPQPLHLAAEELYQHSPTQFEAIRAQVFSSKLPSDPGLKIVLARATVDQKTIERRSIFGQPILDRATGQPQSVPETLVRGENVVLQLEGFPIFYLPAVQGNANDPLGPLQSIAFKQDRIFGTQVATTFDVWNLLNREPLPGTRWTFDADYLSRRGPALGTRYDYRGEDLLGLVGPYSGDVRLYGLHDEGTDILGGTRGEFDNHPEWRGRAFWRHAQRIFDDFTLQSQLSLLSDKNFLEQYYKQEFDTDINQETFVYLKYQRDTVAASILAKPNVRRWVTEDVWLPRADGVLLGQSFLDVFTYNLRASAGYAELHTPRQPPFPFPPQQFTDVQTETGRFDVIQDLSLPFYLGPVKVAPYGVLDLTYYTDDLSGESNGRLYGAGGVRTSMPLSRLYPSICSDLFNLNGVYHKAVLGANYYIADSSDPFFLFPQLDRLNDDATDQAMRDIYPRQPTINTVTGQALATSAIFNPQLYAIRRLVDNRVDTLDTIEVVRADVRQRWQTKRGYPGLEHVVDYVTLDTSASFFPHPDRDNFGKSVAFLEYDTTWNVGDRTALVSTGWFDPFEGGARVVTIGAFLNRPDRTSFFIGYRFIDPIDSRALTTASTYIFSPKYAVTGSMTFDFGVNEALSNSVVITRMGTDLTMSVGFTYNALVNNFGFTFEVVPNVVAAGRRGGVLGRTGLMR